MTDEIFPPDYGLIDLAADGLRQHHRDGSAETLARLEEHLAAIDAVSNLSSELLPTRVALLAELVAGGAEAPTALQDAEIERAADSYLLQVQGLAQPGSVYLEALLLHLGVSLLKLERLSTDRASKIGLVTWHLASIYSSVDAIRHLLGASMTAAWGSEVRIKAALTAWQYSDHLGPNELGLLLRLTDALEQEVEIPEASRKALALARHGDRNAALPDVTSEFEGFWQLLHGGRYEAAEMYLGQFRDAPGLVATVARNLSVLPALHLGRLDHPEQAADVVASLALQARVSEAPKLAERLGAAAPKALLREVIAHHTPVGCSESSGIAAHTAEALCDSEVVRLSSDVPPMRALAADLVDVRRGVHRPPTRLEPARGITTVHLVDVSVSSHAFVFAQIVIRPNAVSAAQLVSFTGTRQRLLLRVLRDPQRVESLSEDDEALLASCLKALVPDHEGSTVVVPAPVLWSLPFEAFLSGIRVSMSVNCWASMNSPRLPQESPLRMCFVGDPDLPGARLERSVLEQMNSTGSVEVRVVESLSGLNGVLQDNDMDVLCLSLHGSSTGFAYSLHLGTETISTQGLLQLRLPPVVVAAGCKSGRTSDRLNLATVLAARTSATIVSLWDLDDRTGAAVLGDFYHALGERRSIVAAWKQVVPTAPKFGLRLLAGH